MPSLIPGFDYDIFISYRHKDNKYDGWVTEFVSNLKKELEATFKEDVSIYFDENPHDGLLETHIVSKSLEEKLRCLIFIPIISQTYCDPKSFAWQYELCAFNKLASKDSFGRDIRLHNGNFASRVLPIRIHDLDAEDKNLLEKELNGPLRAIEFIYKEAGVNRPLKPADNKKDNKANTDYRNQINKVANSIKEIISSLKNPEAHSVNQPGQIQLPSQGRQFRRVLVGIFAVLALAFLSFVLYSQLSKPEPETELLARSIAVLPFVNMSNDAEQDYFSAGITEEITARLSKIEGLKVKSRTTVTKYKNQSKDAVTIANELGVSNIIAGSVRKQGNRVAITVQLINGKTDDNIWSETYNRELEDIFEVQSDIAQQIARRFLKNVSGADEKKLVTPPTQNSIAYDLYLKAQNLFSARIGIGGKLTNRQKATYLLKEAIILDPAFADAYASLSENFTYTSLSVSDPKHLLDSAILLANKAIALSPDRERGYLAMSRVMYWLGEDEGLKYLLKAEEIKPFSTVIDIVQYYLRRNQIAKAFDWTKKGIAYDPLEPDFLAAQGRVYYHLGLMDSLGSCVARSRKLRTESDNSNLLALNYFMFTRNNEEYSKLSNKLFALDEKEHAFNMGLLYLFQRNWKKADSCLARSNLPNEIDAGLTKIQLGQTEAGKKMLNNFIQAMKVFSGDNYWHLMNISRAYAAMQDSQYIEYFEMAVKKGWHDYAFFLHDPFFDNVRESKEFQKIQKEMAEQNDRYLNEFYSTVKQ